MWHHSVCVCVIVFLLAIIVITRVNGPRHGVPHIVTLSNALCRILGKEWCERVSVRSEVDQKHPGSFLA